MGMLGRLATVIVLAFGLAGCTDHRISLSKFLEMREAQEMAATTQPASPVVADKLIETGLGPYRVGPSDVLLVTLTTPLQVGALPPMRVRVNRGGMLELPMVKPMKVAGMELQDVENVVRSAYVPDVYQQLAVSVELISGETTNVLVVGSVAAPGLVQLYRNEKNMLHAIVRAGGVSEASSGVATLRRLRRPAEEVTLDLTDPVELQGALSIDPLESGDIIEVHAANPNTLYVGGLVNAPRPQAYPPGVEVTILQALAASGGVRTDVTPKEATLIHRMPDGSDVQVKLDLNRISTGKDPNITLDPGDIVWVPETAGTKVQDWFNRNFFIRVGASATVNYDVTGVEFLNRQDLQAGRGGTTRNLSDRFDPFGQLLQNQALQVIGSRAAAAP
jgi:polysaccharide export outer membrane protein